MYKYCETSENLVPNFIYFKYESQLSRYKPTVRLCQIKYWPYEIIVAVVDNYVKVTFMLVELDNK